MTENRDGGGVTISGSIGDVGGDIVGRDKIITTVNVDLGAVRAALQPVGDAVLAAPQDQQAEAKNKLTAIEAEVVKGAQADDRVVAKLIKGLVGLVPSAASAIGAAFGAPVLAGIAGPVTKFVLDELGGE